MPSSVAQRIKQTREKIARIRAALSAIEYLCSGTLHHRTKVCGRLTCRCARDPLARHGPYYEWGHLKGGKLMHRVVTPQQAQLPQQAIANQRHAKMLMRAWEEQTERLIDLEAGGSMPFRMDRVIKPDAWSTPLTWVWPARTETSAGE